MTKAEFLTGTDTACNTFLNASGVKFDDLPRQVRSRLKQLSEQVQRALPGDVAYDMAMNDKGAAVARAESRAGVIVAERRRYIREQFAILLQRRNAFTL
jgi:hypothetical protein